MLAFVGTIGMHAPDTETSCFWLFPTSVLAVQAAERSISKSNVRLTWKFPAEILWLRLEQVWWSGSKEPICVATFQDELRGEGICAHMGSVYLEWFKDKGLYRHPKKMEMQRWEVQKHVRKAEITKHVMYNTLPMAYGNNQTRLDWAKGRNANLIQIERVWRNVGRWATRSVWSSRFVNGVYFLKAIFKHDAKVWKLTNTRGHSCRCEFTFLSKQIWISTAEKLDCFFENVWPKVKI